MNFFSRVLLCLALACVLEAAAEGELHELAADRARLLAAKPYEPPKPISDALANISYELHRGINFREEKALWREEGNPFFVEFFHPGGYHKDLVTINEVNSRGTREIPFETNFFAFPREWNPSMQASGFAGFKIFWSKDYFGEVASFLGASYFRMLGAGQTYGSSARALALSTTTPPEEFPAFREFWLEKPGREAGSIIVIALMDSPSVAGAYRFAIKPGETTVTTVSASLFPRKELAGPGIAPITSMFFHDENNRPAKADFRQEVHDSDGLQLHTGAGQWIWRPLAAVKGFQVNTHLDDNPAGFGLMQRDRNPEHYGDLVAHYERRPSVWVKPLDRWGPGAVTLVRLPTASEYHDNVAAFWAPAAPIKPGEPFHLNYEVHWATNSPAPPVLGQVRSTRIGLEDADADGPERVRFVVEFEGGPQDSSSIRGKDLTEAVIECPDNRRIIHHTLQRNGVNGARRLVVELARPGERTELRAWLALRGRAVTETWSYTWEP